MLTDRGGLCTPRLVFGLFVLAIGVVFFLDNFGVLDADRVLRFWPVVFIGIGLASVTQPGRSSHVGGYIWIAVGSWLLLDELNLIRFSFSDFWPLLLVALGATIIWRAIAPLTGGVGIRDDSTVRALAVMSGVERTSASKAFRSADLTAVMGGCELDLRRATITDGPAVVDVFAFWGGIEIRVPEHWAVDNKVLPFMGGVEDRTLPAGEVTERLVVRGMVIMGGVEIKH